jgi:IS5 family transposase
MARRHRFKEAFKATGLRGFFSEDQQRAKLEQLGDPLVRLAREIPWEAFRETLSVLYDKERKGAAGRKPIDVVLMFKILILQRLYNLSDDQTEYQIRDRASFQRFLSLEVDDGSPDAKTIWLFRERIKELGLERDLFFRFEMFLHEKGLHAKGGQIVDATIVQVPRQRNTREENDAIKSGNLPEDWEQQPHKLAQKDLDAEWTKKNGLSFYGYKSHNNVDATHKFIRDYTTTGAAVHDGRQFDDVLDTEAKDRPAYADSAYRSEECEENLKTLGIESRIHERAYRNTPLTEEQKASNREKSKVRVRVEHVFGCLYTSMHRATFIRSIGSARACVMVGLMNLGYNILRFLQVTRVKLQATG